MSEFFVRTVAVVALGLLPLSAAIAQVKPAPAFSTEQEAKAHCSGGDTVVWVNQQTHVYHLQGERWYGNTKHGAYECRKDADAEGDRETRNGQ